MTDKLNLTEPSHDCPLCPRLAEFRALNRQRIPSGFNGPVPGWGDRNAQVLIVGLAPGLHGSNTTGRPFTGDYAGDLLFATLLKYGLAEGEYLKRPDDSLQLKNAFIASAVRCVPPENKPLPAEVHTCRPFLESEIKQLPNLKAMLALGTIAHQSAIKAAGGKLPKYKFAHGAVHKLPSGVLLFDSYHCSRYNTNTGLLTTEMFEAVVENIVKHLPAA